MAYKANVLVCNGGAVANTGYGDCAFHPSQILKAYKVPRGKRFSDAEIGDIMGTLKAMAILDASTSRCYPWATFEEFDTPDVEVAKDTLASGRVITLFEKSTNWSGKFYEGGTCLNKALRSHNGSGNSFVFVTANQVILTKIAGEYAGIPVDDTYTAGIKFATSSTADHYMTSFNFDPVHVNDNLVFIDKVEGTLDVFGMNTIELSVNTAITVGGLVKLNLTHQCGSVNYAELYPAILNGTALYKATNYTTGGAITVSTCTYNSTTKGMDVTLNTADPDYPAINGKIQITLDVPSALATAGVLNAEGSILVFTRLV
jgi:hypothetical protein